MIYDFNQEANGNTLKYEDGQWTEVKSPLKFLSAESMGYDEETWDKLIKRSEYETTPAQFGVTNSFNYEVYHFNGQTGSGKPRYFVNLCLGSYYQHVVVEDYHNLLQLLNFLAPIASSAKDMKASSSPITYSQRMY